MFDSQSFDLRHPELTPPPPARKTRKRKAKRRAAPNYAGRNRPATERLHNQIGALLEVHDGLTLREIASTIGISRQLARYHVLKMVAHRRVLVLLEPCEGNGGVQYRVWERAAYAMQAIRELHAQGVAA